MLHHHHHGHSPPLALIFTISGDEVGTATNIMRLMPWLFNNFESLLLLNWSMQRKCSRGWQVAMCVHIVFHNHMLRMNEDFQLLTLKDYLTSATGGVLYSRSWFEWNAIHNNIVHIKIIRNSLTVIIAGQVWSYCDNFLQTVSGTKLMKQLYIIIISNGVISTITISKVTITMKWTSFPMHLGANQSSREPTKAPRSQPTPWIYPICKSTQFVITKC